MIIKLPNFEDEILTKCLKTKFRIYLLVTPINHTVHDLYNMHHAINIRNYIFPKQIVNSDIT